MSNTPSVTVLGLGAMGFPMAENLAKLSSVVHVWNRSFSKAEALAQKCENVQAHANIADAISASNYIFIIMFDFKSIEESIPKDANLQGKYLINNCTIAVEESQALCKRFTNQGATFVECPVLGTLTHLCKNYNFFFNFFKFFTIGTNTVAIAGKLHLMLSCTKDHYDFLASTQLFSPLGQMHYIGEQPKAIQLKLAFNFMVAGLTTVFANSLQMVKQSGLNVEKYLEILRSSAFYFKYVDVKVDRMLNHEYNDPNFTSNGLLKDLNAIDKQLNTLGINNAITQALIEMFNENVKQGLGEKDFSSVFETFVKDNNPEEKK